MLIDGKAFVAVSILFVPFLLHFTLCYWTCAISVIVQTVQPSTELASCVGYDGGGQLDELRKPHFRTQRSARAVKVPDKTIYGKFVTIISSLSFQNTGYLFFKQL